MLNAERSVLISFVTFIAMQPDIEQLKTTYKNLPDNKLIELALYEAAGLRPEAIDVLKAEMRKRGFEQEISDIVNAQLLETGSKGFEEYVQLIRRQPCPLCGSMQQPLNAAVVGTVTSFLVFTSYHKSLTIACPACLNRALQTGTSITKFLGWWGLPWGIIRSIQALTSNSKAFKIIDLPEPTDTLIDFIKTNAGIIESLRKNDSSIQKMLKNLNKENN